MCVGNLNVSDFVVAVNFLLCSGVVSLIKESGTFTEVEGNINSWKYINILDTYLWPVIARRFPTYEYLFQDDMLLGRQNGGNRKTILNI
jgi:hypothetical protein